MTEGWKRLGSWNGEDVALRMFIPASAEHRQRPTELWIGSKRITLNGDLHPRLARLVPNGYGTPRVGIQQWEPFLAEARFIAE